MAHSIGGAVKVYRVTGSMLALNSTKVLWKSNNHLGVLWFTRNQEVKFELSFTLLVVELDKITTCRLMPMSGCAVFPTKGSLNWQRFYHYKKVKAIEGFCFSKKKKSLV